MDRMSPLTHVVSHSDLTLNDLARLRTLFESECAQDFDDWNPE